MLIMGWMKNYKLFCFYNNDLNSNLVNIDLLWFVINNWWYCVMIWKELIYFCSWNDFLCSGYNNVCLIEIDGFFVN